MSLWLETIVNQVIGIILSMMVQRFINTDFSSPLRWTIVKRLENAIQLKTADWKLFLVSSKIFFHGGNGLIRTRLKAIHSIVRSATLPTLNRLSARAECVCWKISDGKLIISFFYRYLFGGLSSPSEHIWAEHHVATRPWPHQYLYCLGWLKSHFLASL